MPVSICFLRVTAEICTKQPYSTVMGEGYPFDGFDLVCPTRLSAGKKAVLTFVCGVDFCDIIMKVSHCRLQAALVAPSPLPSTKSPKALDLRDSTIINGALHTTENLFRME